MDTHRFVLTLAGCIVLGGALGGLWIASSHLLAAVTGSCRPGEAMVETLTGGPVCVAARRPD